VPFHLRFKGLFKKLLQDRAKGHVLSKTWAFRIKTDLILFP
jgi:hypothetical protein